MAQGTHSCCRPTGGGASPGAKRLERGFQNGTCQSQCHCGGMSSPKWLPSVSPPPGGASLASCLCKALQDQKVGLIQVPFKLLPLCWDLEHIRFFKCHLTVQSLFPIASGSSECKPSWYSKLDILGAYLPYAEPPG